MFTKKKKSILGFRFVSIVGPDETSFLADLGAVALVGLGNV